MSPPLQIYFIRHGETTWSLSGQHTGRTELPLTPNGEEMARQLAPTLKGIDFSLVLTSPRLRARATCELAGLGGSDGKAAQIEPDLAEWDYGDYEGLRAVEVRKFNPSWNVWEDGCPGGEMPADAGVRADRLIARLHDLTGKVALFSHGQFGRVLAARWIGLPVAHGQHLAIDPASVSILSFAKDHPGRRIIALWNATASGSVPAA
jgi:probable phosphoglycerate mutase